MHALSHLELQNGLRMEIEQWGHGDRPLILVHGYTGSRDDFLEQLPALAELGLTIAVDQRGHGGSTNTGDPAHYTFDGLADDLLDALDLLEVEECDLLGHSMGGIVAQHVALRAPERVGSLVLMDTLVAGVALLPEPARTATRAIVENEGMGKLAELMESATRAGRTPLPPPALASIERVGPDRHWQRMRAKLTAMDPVAFTTLGDAFEHWPGTQDRLDEITCPTTVLVGEHDAPFRRPAEALASGIPDAHLVVIAEAAHSPQVENAGAWLEAMQRHVARARS